MLTENELMSLMQLLAIALVVLVLYFVLTTLIGGVNQALADVPALPSVSDVTAIAGLAML
jgi:hypothetical protein